MKIAIAQPNLAIGSFDENLHIIKEQINKAIESSADLVVFPELSTTVKGAKDLLFIPEYLNKANEILAQIQPLSEKIAIVIGGTTQGESGLLNAAFLLQNCSCKSVAFADDLTLEEKKYFSPAKQNDLFKIGNKTFSVVIGQFKKIDGSDCVINLNSTPFEKDKKNIPPNGVCTVLVNHVGLAQEQIYEGGSFISNENGTLLGRAAKFQEDIVIVDTEKATPIIEKTNCREEKIFKALSYAFKEFCRVNNFKKAILGLSGGIDSALTAVIMCDAIGAENVLGITMPSKYSTEGSWQDSYDLARNLGMECRTIPIKPLFDTFINDIQGNAYGDLAEENLQARLRGNILMAWSNRENRVLVSTGNKSEVAMGYCTLYGDTCGGINLISDLYKQEVYALSSWINRGKEIIPQNTITKAPSAELRPNQKDQDSLPDYAILDEILFRYIEGEEAVEKISKDFDTKLVREIINKLNIMEFKRNQLTLCLKLSSKALFERNYPIVNKFRY